MYEIIVSNHGGSVYLQETKYYFKMVIFAIIFAKELCYVEMLGSIRIHLLAHHFFQMCGDYTHANSSDLQGETFLVSDLSVYLFSCLCHSKTRIRW